MNEYEKQLISLAQNDEIYNSKKEQLKSENSSTNLLDGRCCERIIHELVHSKNKDC